MSNPWRECPVHGEFSTFGHQPDRCLNCEPNLAPPPNTTSTFGAAPMYNRTRSLELDIKRAALWGALTAYWLGVISEALAT